MRILSFICLVIFLCVAASNPEKQQNTVKPAIQDTNLMKGKPQSKQVGYEEQDKPIRFFPKQSHIKKTL